MTRHTEPVSDILHVRITPQLAEQLRATATAEACSLSTLCRELLELSVFRRTRPEKTAQDRPPYNAVETNRPRQGVSRPPRGEKRATGATGGNPNEALP